MKTTRTEMAIPINERRAIATYAARFTDPDKVIPLAELCPAPHGDYECYEDGTYCLPDFLTLDTSPLARLHPDRSYFVHLLYRDYRTEQLDLHMPEPILVEPKTLILLAVTAGELLQALSKIAASTATITSYSAGDDDDDMAPVCAGGPYDPQEFAAFKDQISRAAEQEDS